MKIRKIKPLRFPVNQADPVNMGKSVALAWRHIDGLYRIISKDLLAYLNQRLQRRMINHADFIDTDLSAFELADILEEIQRIVDRTLLSADNQGGQLWFDSYLDEAMLKGAQSAVTDLSLQSERYRNERSLQSVIFSSAYFNRAAIARTAAYSNWKGLSDGLRKELADVITGAVLNGDNVKTTARTIKKRLDISAKRAKLIAQTEQLSAYRRAEWDEAIEAKEVLGLNTKLLHFSALKPTTRLTHAARHGKCFDVDEVKVWYQQDGNRFNCYCKQSVIVLNDDGTSDVEPLLKTLNEERIKWVKAIKKRKTDK